MPLNAAHWTIAQSGDIRYTGPVHTAAGSSYATVIEFHRWLQDLADDAVATAATSDFLDITDSTPSERSTDNIITLNAPYNIDQTASEHLYDGSIIQNGGADIWDGLVVIAAPGMNLQILQNGTQVASPFWNSQNNGAAYAGLNYDLNNGYSHRFMLKVRTAGADIDGRRIIGMTRVWGKTFSEFKVNGTARGNNVLALTYADDLNNQTAVGSLTSAPFSDVTNVIAGYNGIDVDANGTPEYYYSKWDKAGCTINQFYERMKYITKYDSAETLYGLSGKIFRGITHQWDYDTEASGPFVEGQAITWGAGATAGTAQLLALKDDGTTGRMFVQLLTGVVPTDNMTINQTGGKTCLVNGAVTERTVPAVICGVSTGSALIGAFGFGLEAADLAATDKVFDLTNTQVTPPNNQTFTVSGLVVGEDYVLVGPESGGTLNTAQFALAGGGLTTNNITSVVVGAAIPPDTPLTGTIRVEDNDGVFRKLHYSSWAGSTFTIDTVDGNEDFGTVQAAAGNDVFISYIDKLATATSASYSAVYSSNRALFVRVRDGGGSPIKTFETTATFGSGGGSATAIRTSDA